MPQEAEKIWKPCFEFSLIFWAGNRDIIWPELFFFFQLEIEKSEGDELRKDGEVKKYLDIISNKNVKLSERVLIPVQQYPKVRPQRSMQHTKERWRNG